MSIVAFILDAPILATPLRLLRCILGIASPSLATADYGRRVKDETALLVGTWLDRWELRLARSVKWPPIINERVEVQVVERGGLTTVLFPRVVSSVDVTGRSDRATRRVLNKWRRRCKVGGEGYEARVVKVWW